MSDPAALGTWRATWWIPCYRCSQPTVNVYETDDGAEFVPWCGCLFEEVTHD